MNNNYFVCSDIHSSASIFKNALFDAGFDISNDSHILIICGDIFDRGNETLETYNFILSIPQKRRILIRGNHEWLYKRLLYKTFPDLHDFQNGTVKTFCQIAGKKYENYYDKDSLAADWKSIIDELKQSKITDFIFSDEWVNFYELENYIFVHAFIPLNYDGSYNPNWRNSTDLEWNDAVWKCPWALYKSGLYLEDKTLVCGHWSTSDFFENIDKDYTKANCPIYYNNRLIGLDANTICTKRMNVFVVE